MTMVFGRDSRKPWDKWDRLLAEAYQILEGERCGQCGYPVYICANESEDVQFHLTEQACAVTEKKARYGDNGRGKKKKELPEGTTLQPSVFLVSGGDPSSLRTAYYEAQRAKHEEIEASRRPREEP
jgi:hypothetical protein